MTEIGVQEFWNALGHRPLGVTLVTCLGIDGPRGFLGLSAAHVSATPPRMVVSISAGTTALEGVIKSRAFAINVMPAGTEEIVSPFSSKAISNAERFSSSKWRALTTGAPIYDEALAVFDCRVLRTIELDGTILVIGDVVALGGAGSDAQPLVAWRGGLTPMRS
jgi:flavin reductase (DIM6/NTAB) family NADH-FMN oxidoreductase RutF